MLKKNLKHIDKCKFTKYDSGYFANVNKIGFENPLDCFNLKMK
jgi:hypothetical protein